jgi:hypothetical protein
MLTYKVIEDENILGVFTDSGYSFYFRDIKGSELREVERLINDEHFTVRKSMKLMSKLLIESRGNNLHELHEQLEFEEYKEVLTKVLDLIVGDIMPWFDFLQVAYAFGKKSYSVLPWLLEQDMTTVKDMLHAMDIYLKKEEEHMNNGSKT